MLPSGFPRLPRGAAFLAAALLAAVVSPARAAEAPASAPKDYTLFVGVDLAVQQGDGFQHVVGATDRALVIEAGGQLKEVPQSDANMIRISKGVKLSTVTATIANVKTDSVDRAAARAQFDAMRAYVILNDQASERQDFLQGAILAVQFSGGDLPPSGMDPGGAPPPPTTSDAIKAYADALPGLDQNVTAASTLFFKDMSERSAPTVELTFDVTSPQPLEQAYLIVVAEFAANDKAGEVARQVSARYLGHLDATPRKVKMAHTAAAPGFTFKRFQIGLFADGQEVVTNLSDSRLALTEDQAYQFVVANYLIAQKGQTRPPAPVLMTSRTDLRRRADQAPLNADIFARVDKTGALVALSADEAGTVKVGDTMAAALQKVRFAPALDKGVPVDGRVRFTLASLVN